MSLIDHEDYCRSSTNAATVDILKYEVKNAAQKIKTADRTNACSLCKKTFATQFTLNRHLVAKHKVKGTSCNRLLQCSFDRCKESFNSMDMIRSHLKKHHCIEIRDCQMFSFNSFEAFMNWKMEEEKRTFTKFIRPHGKYKRLDGSEVHQFYCHRSGLRKLESTRLRKLKAQGSCKINAACPATLTAYKLASNAVDCKYFSTHVGHIADLEELYFCKEERKKVNEMASNHSPIEIILNNVRNWLSRDIDIMNDLNKDWNIKISKYMDYLNREKFLNASVTNTIEDLVMFSSDDCTIYARLASGEEICNNDNGFVVILMSATQAKILKKFGNGGHVCISSTRHFQKPRVHLIVVYTLNETRNVIPCAFCLTSKLDVEIYTECIESIKTKIGVIKPKYLTLDDKEDLPKAWASVMSVNNLQMYYCSWFTDNEWRNNLCKITGKLYQKAKFYKALRVLLKEPDTIKFSLLLSSLMKCLKSTYTESFRNYFEKNWMNENNRWAFAHRNAECLQVDLQFEALHLLFSDLCSSKTDHSIEIILQILLGVTRENMFISSNLDLQVHDHLQLNQHPDNTNNELSNDERNEFSDAVLLPIENSIQTADEVIDEIVNLSTQIVYKAKVMTNISTLQCLKENLKFILDESIPIFPEPNLVN